MEKTIRYEKLINITPFIFKKKGLFLLLNKKNEEKLFELTD